MATLRLWALFLNGALAAVTNGATNWCYDLVPLCLVPLFLVPLA